MPEVSPSQTRHVKQCIVAYPANTIRPNIGVVFINPAGCKHGVGTSKRQCVFLNLFDDLKCFAIVSQLIKLKR